MSDLWIVCLKAFAGGTVVVAFSLVGEAVEPKEFSGLFSAAPAVAVASLAVTAFTKGSADAASAAFGMIAGAVAMVAYCIATSHAIPRFGALLGSIASWALWFVVAAGVYVLLT